MSPSPLPVIQEGKSQTSTVATSQLTEDVSEAEAWTALLGLDGFDPFSYDASEYGFPFLASSAADASPFTATSLSLPTEPTNPRETLHLLGDVNSQTTTTGDRSSTPATSTTLHIENAAQFWPSPLPSIGPQGPPLRISDAVISRLRRSLGEEDCQNPAPAALRLFLGTFFDVFNVHLPLLHAPSFDFDDQPEGLLLAMAAIGAMYRLERRAVILLYRAAGEAAPVGARSAQAGFFHRSSGGCSADPRWRSLPYYQTRLLLQYVGILGGDAELAERSLGMIAELSLTVSESDLTDGLDGSSFY